MGPMTGGGRGLCNPYGPINAGFAGPGYYPPMHAGAMMPRYGGWGTPYPAYGVPYAGFGAYPFRPSGMGMGRGVGRGSGMGMGRGMGRGFWGAGRGRWW